MKDILRISYILDPHMVGRMIPTSIPKYAWGAFTPTLAREKSPNLGIEWGSSHWEF